METKIKNTDCAFYLSNEFMNKLSVGDEFKLNKKCYSVKRIGKFNSDVSGKSKSYKTLTLKTDNGQIKFYFIYGIHGNPKSSSRLSDVKQYQFLRDVEGCIVVDVLNIYNPFHELSEIYKIAKK